MALGGVEPGTIALTHTLAVMAESADSFVRTPTLTACNFAALLPTDPILSVWKDLQWLPFENRQSPFYVVDKV